MAKYIVSNAFSVNMMEAGRFHLVEFCPITKERFIETLKEEEWESSIGHQSMADLLSEMTGITIPMNRSSNKINCSQDGYILLAQYTGPRLPEGAIELPEGADIQFYVVHVYNADEANVYNM